MARSNSTEALALPDGSFDFSGGVNSDAVTTVESSLNPNGLKRNMLAWLNNATVRGGGILQRTGWQPLLKLLDSGHWQGGFMYEPDGANPYLVCQVSGILYRVLLESPYTITDLSGGDVSKRNPADTEMAFFCQGENYLLVQAGDYLTTTPSIAVNDYAQPLLELSTTLPLIWDGTTLRRSRGITSAAPGANPDINEIPAATCMWYHGNRIWYAQARRVSAGDMLGGASGHLANHYRDSILSVTENPLCLGGDGFSIPTNAGNIRALRDEVNLNESVAQGRLLIWTRKQVFALTVPPTRTDWINADANNQPLMVVVQKVNGAVGDRAVVPSNGDWFYQSLEPGIRSLITAIRYYDQWGNTPISQNERRALDVNDRSLMRFSSGMEFDNRIWNLVLPEIAADNVNVIHKGVLPLDFDVVTNLQEKLPPIWEGAYDGLQFLQVFNGDFGGLDRGFAAVISEIDSSLNIWELTQASRTENGDNRVTWAAEFPAFTWAAHGWEMKLKQLNGGECWIDKVFGTVDMDVYYRPDADPCWRRWFHTEFCAARDCEEQEDVLTCYPTETFREGYRWPVVFPEPPVACNSMGVRPTTIGYQFQVKIVLKGWCRIRALLLYALPKEKQQFEGISCTAATQEGMAKLPNPFAK